MEYTIVFAILMVIFTSLIVVLNDRFASLSFLGLNFTIAAFFYSIDDINGAVIKATLGLLPTLIIVITTSRLRPPKPRLGPTPTFGALALTIALAYAVAFAIRGIFPESHVQESYLLVILFGLSALIIISQTSIFKFLLGILVLENIGALILAWGTNTIVLTLITEIFVALIALTFALIALMNFREYATIDETKLTKLRG